MKPLLSIAIPTYNRLKCLELLLLQLANEIPKLNLKEIEFLISDNCSTDSTPQLIESFKNTFPTVRVFRSEENQGSDKNITRCFQEAQGDYVWVFGDDDLMKTHAVGAIVDLLKRHAPDLVYMNSTPVLGEISTIRGNEDSSIKLPLDYEMIDARRFAKVINVQLTFISGIITSKLAYEQRNQCRNLRRFQGSSLAQLEWTLDSLVHGTKFIRIHTPLIFSRTHSSGGYNLFEVFGVNFFNILKTVCGAHPDLYGQISHRTLVGYMPWLIWNYRFKNIGEFERKPFLSTLKRGVGHRWEFWICLVPISTLPKTAASFFYLASKVINKITHRL